MTSSDAAAPHRQEPRFTARAFGLRWSSDCPLPRFGAAADDREPCDVTVDRAARLGERPNGRRINNGEVFADGARFRFGDTVFDTFGDHKVSWWSPTADELPYAFFGTVTAIILAWRRMVPLHASAVAFGGRAMIIAGPAGAGKSTLCNALIGKGGKLVSDDLSALMPMRAGDRPMLQPGRPAIRLAAGGCASQGDKAFREAPMVDPSSAVELAALVILRETPIGPGPAEAMEALRRQLFRPAWMHVLPFGSDRTATLLHTAQRVQMIAAPGASDRPGLSVGAKADMVLKRLGDLDWNGEPRQ